MTLPPLLSLLVVGVNEPGLTTAPELGIRPPAHSEPLAGADVLMFCQNVMSNCTGWTLAEPTLMVMVSVPAAPSACTKSDAFALPEPPLAVQSAADQEPVRVSLIVTVTLEGADTP